MLLAVRQSPPAGQGQLPPPGPDFITVCPQPPHSQLPISILALTDRQQVASSKTWGEGRSGAGLKIAAAATSGHIFGVQAIGGGDGVAKDCRI